MKKYAIIVAGGRGERMQTELPKQFISIGGKPILMRTLEAFFAYDSQIELILVLPENQISLWESLCLEFNFKLAYKLTKGGATRFNSVKNGLALVKEDSLVAVHDGVRPFVNLQTITKCFDAALENGTAIPVVEPVDSIRFVDSESNKTVNRADFRLVQTPQVFESCILKNAYEQEFSAIFTDDASVVEGMGEKVFLVEGNRENIKITTPFDLLIAEAILKGNICD